MRVVLIALAVLTLFQNFQCSKNEFISSECFKGRIEDIPNCGAPVIKILAGDLSQIQYEASWQQPYTGEVFTNVFVAENFCDIQEAEMEPGEEFYFRVVSDMDDQDCVICAALFPVPSKTNKITIVPAGLCGDHP